MQVSACRGRCLCLNWQKGALLSVMLPFGGAESGLVEVSTLVLMAVCSLCCVMEGFKVVHLDCEAQACLVA